MNYHEMPPVLYESACHAVSAAHIIDLTPQSGRLACWAVRNRVGYVGIAGTVTQKDHIERVVLEDILASISDPGTKLYAPTLAEATAKPKGQKREDDDDDEET